MKTNKIISEILSENIISQKGFKTDVYFEVSKLRIVDHINEIFTRTGIPLGIVIQPYVQATPADIKLINDLGFDIQKIDHEGWYARNTHPYLLTYKLWTAKDYK